jgi:hypothetical protein
MLHCILVDTSRARLARAADTRRVGVLIGTAQQDVAIMAAESAEALFLAKPPFDDIRNVPLRLIVSFGSHVLVCRPDFMARHGYLLAQTLAEHKDALPKPTAAPEGIIPAHRGSYAFFAGEEMSNSGHHRGGPTAACRGGHTGNRPTHGDDAGLRGAAHPCRPRRLQNEPHARCRPR